MTAPGEAGGILRRVFVDPRQYYEIPPNPHGISAGSLLLPTETPIVASGSSLDFVLEQGGDEDTFIFLFGMRRALIGVDVLEGVFLSEAGPGFRPTWAFEQLMRETELGGWFVVPTREVLRSWTGRVEARMNRGA